jgi:hypothetical protein
MRARTRDGAPFCEWWTDERIGSSEVGLKWNKQIHTPRFVTSLLEST